MYKIIKNIFENELYYRGSLILKYKIEYPKMISNNMGANRFNQYNYTKALQLKQYVESELFKEAKETYDYNVSNGYPIMVYEIISNYTITYNQDPLVSLYSDEYIYSGGAHGNTIRSSQNWNIHSGNQFPLENLFNHNCSYILYILKEINKQIEQQITDGVNYYFENYCNLVLTTIDLNNFYLEPKYIIIFFQQYDIAPYSSGIPTFLISRYSSLL